MKTIKKLFNKRTQKKAFFLATVLTLAILLTGTFAWQSFSQRAFNPAWGQQNFGGRIHDNYDGFDYGLHNKDIYAENFGDYDELFVRFRLREFLSLDGEPVISTSEINDPSTWPIYVSEHDDAHVRRALSDTALIGSQENIDGDTVAWTLGHADDVTKVFMPTHNQAVYLATLIDPSVPDLFAHAEAFRMTEATGTGVDNIADAERDDRFIVADVTHARDFSRLGHQTGPGDGSHDYWQLCELDVDDAPIATPDCTYEAPLIINILDGVDVRLANRGNFLHFAQETLTPEPGTGGIMTMSEWLTAGRPQGNFWILDVDGWFYWNGYIPAGEATSLLLDEIFIPKFDGEWEYVIQVDSDFFTEESIDDLIDISVEALSIFE